MDKTTDKTAFEVLEKAVIDVLASKYWDKEDGGYYEREIYADYHDEMQDDTAIEILTNDNSEYAFLEKLDEWYGDAAWDLRYDLCSEIVKTLSLDTEKFPDGVSSEDVMDILTECVSYSYPYDHYLKQEFCVNIMVDTGDGNHDYVLNDIVPAYCGDVDEPIDEKSSILWLARQQGYTKEQLETFLKDTDTPLNEEKSKFLKSVYTELANVASHMNTLTFLVKMNLENMMRLNDLIKHQDDNGHHFDNTKNPDCGEIVIGKDVIAGLYNPWNGGGSVLELEMEKDITLPIKFIRSALPDGGDGYAIANVYGVNCSLWNNGEVKEIREPARLKEKTRVAIESTNDYTDSSFCQDLVDIDIKNPDGSYGTVIDMFRIVTIGENGIKPYDARVFASKEDATKAVLKSDKLELSNYDDLVHEAMVKFSERKPEEPEEEDELEI